MDPHRTVGTMLLLAGCAAPAEGDPHALLGQRVGERQALAISRADFESRENRAYSYSWEQQRYGDDGQLAITFVGVVEGEVVVRAYEEPCEERTVADPPDCYYGWGEFQEDVGEHDEPFAAPAWTLEQVYDHCRDEILALPEDHEISLSFNKRGFLASCTALPPGCDGGSCRLGLTVDALRFTNSPP